MALLVGERVAELGEGELSEKNAQFINFIKIVFHSWNAFYIYFFQTGAFLFIFEDETQILLLA